MFTWHTQNHTISLSFSLSLIISLHWHALLINGLISHTYTDFAKILLFLNKTAKKVSLPAAIQFQVSFEFGIEKKITKKMYTNSIVIIFMMKNLICFGDPFRNKVDYKTCRRFNLLRNKSHICVDLFLLSLYIVKEKSQYIISEKCCFNNSGDHTHKGKTFWMLRFLFNRSGEWI